MTNQLLNPQDTSFHAWFNAVHIEFNHECNLQINSKIIEVYQTNQLIVEVKVLLEKSGRSEYNQWSERTTDRELLYDPSRFSFLLQSLSPLLSQEESTQEESLGSKDAEAVQLHAIH